MPRPSAHVFWLFGLSGAGKTTLGRHLAENLRARSYGVLSLDGDRVRQGLCAGLGFATEDRTENIRRAAEVARLAWESGLCVVASFITPTEGQRALAREIVGRGNLSLVHVAATAETCARRDVKGLYARARSGGVPHFTGVSAAFEEPEQADLTIATVQQAPEDSASRLAAYAFQRLSS